MECNKSSIELDSVRVLYEYLFNAKASMKDKNKLVFLTMQNYVQEREFKIISDFFLDAALRDLHPSYIKSALIMTEAVDHEVARARKRAIRIFKEKILK